MRHILIDRARQRSSMRHGGSQQRVDIEHIDIPAAARERVVRFYSNREQVDKLHALIEDARPGTSSAARRTD